MKLYYPVKPFLVTQKFGETAFLKYYQDNGVKFKGHNGVDVATAYGTPVRAAHDGVAYYEVDGSQGHGVVIRSNETFEYEGAQVYYKSIYWHLIADNDPVYKSPVAKYKDIAKMGMVVKAGDIIGYADSTGLSTGNHLHFSIKPALPGEPDWMWYNVEQNNGYMGAIDPTPYFNGVYAEDVSPDRFYKNLYIGAKDPDVERLQKFLKRHGLFTLPYTTEFYGPLTAKAVLAYQLSNKIISSPIESAFGYYFGPKTRAYINK